MKRNENASHLKRPSDRNPPRRGGPRPPPPPLPPPPPPPLPLAFEEAFSSKGFPPLVLASSNKVSLWCVDDDAFFLSFFFSFVFFSLFFFETEKFFEKKKIVSFRSSQKNEEKTKTRDVWAGSLMSRGGGAETGGLLLSGGPFRSAFDFGCATPNERHPLFLLRVSLLSFLFRFREVRSFLSRARVFFCSSVSSFFGGFY